MITDLIRRTRTFRRFDASVAVKPETLVELLDLARLGGSARNLQPFKYMPVVEEKLRSEIFPCLGWAGYLPDWPGPPVRERPAAYIVCLLDTTIAGGAEFDLGIASQNILLGATERGLGGCRIASLSPDLADILALPPHLRIQLVIALGKPIEEVKLVESDRDAPIRYWRDDKQTHFVPKRRLEDILVSPPEI